MLPYVDYPPKEVVAMSDPAADAMSLVLLVLLSRDPEAVALLRNLSETEEGRRILKRVPAPTVGALQLFLQNVEATREILEKLE